MSRPEVLPARAAGRRTRILVLSETLPMVAGNMRAAEVVVHEICRFLAAETDFEVAFAEIGLAESTKSAAAQAGIDGLMANGVRFLDRIRLVTEKPRPFPIRVLLNLLGPGDHLIPGLGQEDKIIAVCRSAGWIPDIVIPIWSEVATAAASRLPWPVYAYYGNPDHKVVLANLRLQWCWERRNHPQWLARHLYDRLLQRRLKRAHMNAMRRLALVGDVAENDADSYRAAGINAYYVNNMWPSAGNDDWRNRRDAAEQLSPLKIAASIGQVSGTGNSFGFWAIGEEILPALRRRFGAGKFELHVYGRRTPRDFLRPLLADPAIKLRGFVEDIDGELYSCPVFMVANNRHDFKVGHTRFLHAWSLGACVVAWRDSALAMPEIVHDRNALLADTPDEMVELIARAAADVGLRRRLGEEGRATLRRNFQPETVVADMARRIRSLA
jgi:glycosyltransferase involved in cell wall biosynthesis